MNQNIISMIKNGESSCIALDKEQKIFYQESGIGVKPIITPMRTDRKFFEGSKVADKVIGKAAAMLLILSGVSEVYGEIMSISAKELFDKEKIPCSWSELVPYIENRTATGMCPLECCVKEEENLEQAWKKINETIAELMKK